MKTIRLFWPTLVLVLASAPCRGASASIDEAAVALAARYAREVDMRLDVPTGEQSSYATRLRLALAAAGVRDMAPQYFLLVDRSPMAQAAFVYRLSTEGEWLLIGASPVSTGRAGGFEYFITPLGVFEHVPGNMDFRAEGTRNERGIRGYGVRGMRVFDFGWAEADRTWGPPGKSLMRLQVHATDPDLLERELGRPRSKGCIRIPSSLNIFLDRYGLLDDEYERTAAAGRNLWVLRADREPVAGAGKYLIVVDSGRESRPAWSPWPPRRDDRRAPRETMGAGKYPHSPGLRSAANGRPREPSMC